MRKPPNDALPHAEVGQAVGVLRRAGAAVDAVREQMQGEQLGEVNACKKKWDDAVSAAEEDLDDKREELNLASDDVRSITEELIQYHKTADENPRVQELIPIYHLALWEAGVRSKVWSDNYNHGFSLYRWEYKAALAQVNSEIALISQAIRAIRKILGAGIECGTVRRNLASDALQGGGNSTSDKWKSQCSFGHSIVGFWRQKGAEGDIMDFKCCSPSAGFVDHTDCSVEVIPEGKSAAPCSDGVAIAMFTEGLVKKPALMKCCALRKNRMTSKCSEVNLEKQTSWGGASRADDLWNAECPIGSSVTSLSFGKSGSISGFTCCIVEAVV